ncbi:alanine--tRNA ligase, mitochondrial [Stomoxys calcitrans]|uniref:Alanine--tRNA ligase n=1 Tax=Stomoxys calcitrans TaxID=35570 RepID=A0A1I8PLQ2_STOCA|nr:alanine--tRNA ligase, mitochondrial [Stomoxys calcitrans]
MHSSAKKLHRVLSSREIRKTFTDFFINNHEHTFVRSSPVVPWCDPTVSFVNAGMNQFKSVFLGKTQATHKRVTNSQKCVRVGGKHNDLSVVGEDGYHHTFFEMLGNWSFGDYFKREACAMALELLRGPYNIDPSRLYVTYFAGDKILGLPADLESVDIWRSLGFPSSRILPFGTKDNFWEMGSSGPCGPCTEIHIDHRPDLGNTDQRSKLVNAGRSDLTELWNLVFIQYNRHEDGSISQLPSHHVDTGMGFERLTAILQNKSSNYDTDLFVPIFDVINKISKAPHYSGCFPTPDESATLDTGYRILADHARMVAVCLADGMLPDQNQKLRRVLRKAITVSENVFGNETLLQHIIPVVADSLGSAYPEIANKQNDILELISHEQEVFKALRESSSKAFSEVLVEYPNLEDVDLMECPGFVPAYREFQSQKHTFKNHCIPGEFLFKLSDTYGLTEEHFKKLAQSEEMTYDSSDYKDVVTRAKLKAKSSMNFNEQENTHLKNIEKSLVDITKSLPSTDNHYKYSYTYNELEKEYAVPDLNSKVLGILYNDVCVNEVVSTGGFSNTKDIISIVTEASNFYYESGGQQADKGCIILEAANGESLDLKVIAVRSINDCVIHMCELPKERLKFTLAVGDNVVLNIDKIHRKRNICHHTAVHLLNGVMRALFNKVTYQVSSAVTSDHCKLEVGLIGKRITKEDVSKMEELIRRIISANAPVNVELCNASDILQKNNITMVPGEVYPETGLRLVTINCEHYDLQSKELCCGTHVTNTKELEQFCITNVKQTNRARYAFTAVAGDAADKVHKVAALLQHRVDMLEKEIKTDKMSNATEVELQKIRHNLLHTDIMLPYVFKMDTLERINIILKRVKETARTNIKDFVDVEMRNLLQEKPLPAHPFILHYISSSALVEEVPLQKATKHCTDRPILVVAKSDGIVKARCCVPKKFQTENFNADKWLSEFASPFSAQIAAPKGQDPHDVCNMKGKKASMQFDDQLEIAMQKAHNYAAQHLK